jgi:UDP-N-acetylmuramate--alanine ligase
MELKNLKNVYFIGIGGIGMSAIARYFNNIGVAVAGYDKTQTALTDQLAAEGIAIHYDDDIRHVPADADLVIYTPAIPKDHKELNYVWSNGYRVYKRAQVLGMISRSQRTIAVAGTHGKTTTTSLLTHLLRTGGVDCTAFLGGISQSLGSNFVQGESDWVVLEADEFDRSFLQLSPTIGVITSMDADHLDIYGDVHSMQQTYCEFATKVQAGGSLYYKYGLPLGDLTNTHTIHTASYSLHTGDHYTDNLHVEDGHFVFDYVSASITIPNIRVAMPGRHNIENAVAAISVALQVGVQPDAIRVALGNFKGVQRRFEWVVQTPQITYIDDYAHHPEELRAAIQAARELYPHKKLTGIFQPHLYSRTRDFVDGFAEVLDTLDEAILLPIYPARELPLPGVESDLIRRKMNRTNVHILQKSEVIPYLTHAKIEVLMTLGAGDIDTLVKPIRNLLTNH